MRHRPLLLPRRTYRDLPHTSLAIVSIVFLLLFYFLVAGSQSSGPAFSIDVPQVNDQPNEDVHKAVLIIDDRGVLNLNGTVVVEENLQDALSQIENLDVIADRNASALDLLDLLQTPGFQNIDLRLVTENTYSSE